MGKISAPVLGPSVQPNTETVSWQSPSRQAPAKLGDDQDRESSRAWSSQGSDTRPVSPVPGQIRYSLATVGVAQSRSPDFSRVWRNVIEREPASAVQGPVASHLPAPVRTRMEGAFGRGFSDVTIHQNSSRATGSTHAVTEGRDVHFGAGRYQPGSPAGDRLIGHELAHVVQQSNGTSASQAFDPVQARGALEADADRAALAAAAGRPAQVMMATDFGARQAFEAWEHTAMGDAHGGDKVTIKTSSGVELTYGQVVALSGDFYRSPEALMEAPAAELRAILAIMKGESEQAARNKGRPTQEEIAENNAEYEMATTDNPRSSHHSHTPFGEDDPEHGPVEDGEHIPQGGEVPTAEDAYTALAQANSSHFSPENIKVNYKPKHQMALKLAREAWQARNPDTVPATVDAGVRPSTRESGKHNRLPGEGAAPATGAEATGVDAADTTGQVGNDTAVRNVDVNSGEAGQTKEAMAWLTDGFASHYLTDAFAGGHLVSGVVGRQTAKDFYGQHRAQILDALASCLLREDPIFALRPELVAVAIAGMGGILEFQAHHLGLKVIHDDLNQNGVWVKNALGTEWRATGDAHAMDSPETMAQAKLAAKTSRDAVQDVLDTGGTQRAFTALDYIPDVARFGDGPYQAIELFSTDGQVFTAMLTKNMLSTDPASNRLYRLMVDNAIPQLDSGLRKAWREAKKVAAWTKKNVVESVREGAAWTEKNVVEPVQEGAAWTKKNVVESVREGAAWTEKNIVEPVQEGAAWTKDKAIEAKDVVVEKTIEAKDAVVEESIKAKNLVVEKAIQTRDIVVDKAIQTRDVLVDKAIEADEWVKENVVEPAKKAGQTVEQTGAEAADWVKHLVVDKEADESAGARQTRKGNLARVDTPATQVRSPEWSGATLHFSIAPVEAPRVWVKFFDKDAGFDYSERGRRLQSTLNEDAVIGEPQVVHLHKGLGSITAIGDADNPGDTYVVIFADPQCSNPIWRSDVQP
jgi:hypothetical protein